MKCIWTQYHQNLHICNLLATSTDASHKWMLSGKVDTSILEQNSTFPAMAITSTCPQLITTVLSCLILTTTDAALAAVNNRLKPTAHSHAIPRLFSYTRQDNAVIIFTARRYASAVLCCRRVSVHLSICPSRHKPALYKIAKHTVTHIKPRDSPGSLVYACQRSRRNYSVSQKKRHCFGLLQLPRTSTDFDNFWQKCC